jgi:transcriptional regulator with XRE-family HTH domain
MAATHAVGPLLAYWRKTRRMSQLALAHEAEVSPRHVCFIETGRSKPSREMILLLATVLDVPLRERNSLLLAGGFAPVYRESGLADAELAGVRAAIDAILRHHRPFPAVVMDRHWNIRGGNDAADRFFAHLLAGGPSEGAGNVLRLMFHPKGLRPYVTNWEATAEVLVQRAHREAVGGVQDPGLTELLAEITSYPGVPKGWRTPDLGRPLVPVVPVAFAKNGERYTYFSAVTTLGTPQDITLQEIRLECFFPADVETERAAHALAARVEAEAAVSAATAATAAKAAKRPRA